MNYKLKWIGVKSQQPQQTQQQQPQQSQQPTQQPKQPQQPKETPKVDAKGKQPEKKPTQEVEEDEKINLEHEMAKLDIEMGGQKDHVNVLFIGHVGIIFYFILFYFNYFIFANKIIFQIFRCWKIYNWRTNFVKLFFFFYLFKKM